MIFVIQISIQINNHHFEITWIWWGTTKEGIISEFRKSLNFHLNELFVIASRPWRAIEYCTPRWVLLVLACHEELCQHVDRVRYHKHKYHATFRHSATNLTCCRLKRRARWLCDVHISRWVFLRQPSTSRQFVPLLKQALKRAVLFFWFV